MGKKVMLFNIPVDALTMEGSLELIINKIHKREHVQHIVVNAGKIVDMQNNALLRNSVLNSEIINADGQAVVWASRLLGEPLPERVAGIDLMEQLVVKASELGLKCFFLGAKDEVVAKVVNYYSNLHGYNIIAGYRNGYFNSQDEDMIIQQINDAQPDILFVAMSSPKKEIFINKYRERLNVPFVMGVGGSFDVVAGITKRAPLWMQRIGLEWFFRFIQEPKRMWKRYLFGNIKFILLVINESIKKNK